MRKEKKLDSSVYRSTQLLTRNQPFFYKEAYKSLRTNLNFATLGGKNKVISVTSSVPGEGKTTFSINLAITLSEDGKKVLLIDGDLRNPSIHRYLRLKQQKNFGLSHILSSGTEGDEGIGFIEKFQIYALLSGAIPPNPIELLGSSNFKSLLLSLYNSYDYIIIDTPPVGVVADASVISQASDCVIMVVGQGISTQEYLIKAKKNLENIKANVIGAVLNNYDISVDYKARNSDYYYYGID